MNTIYLSVTLSCIIKQQTVCSCILHVTCEGMLNKNRRAVSVTEFKKKIDNMLDFADKNRAV